MRVLYLTNYQGPAVVARRRIVRNRALGASTKVETISRALARVGHDVTVLSTGTPAERSGRAYPLQREQLAAGCGSVPVVYLPALDLPLLNLWSGRGAVAAYLRWHRRWDVAIVYNLSPTTLPAARALRGLGIPLVFEYEDDASATLEKGPGGNGAGSKLLREARGLASGVIAVSDELERQMAVPNSLVANGAVPDAAFDIPIQPFRVGERPLRLLYAGGLTHPKGVDLLLDAIDAVRANVELTIVGAGPLADTVRRRAATSARVVYEGEVSRKRLEELLARAHVCVNPHRVDAGQSHTLFPFKISEYVAYGAVVVSSQLGKIPTEVSDVIRTYDRDTPGAIAEALDDVAIRHAGLAAGLEAARRSLQATVSETALGARISLVLSRAVQG